MSRVVLAERRRDVKLVEQYYRHVESADVDTFVGEEVAHSRQTNRESDAVRNFRDRYNPYDVLAKSENGKPDLKMVFSKLVGFLADGPFDVSLLVDLDGDDYESFVADLREGIRDRHGCEFTNVTFLENGEHLLAARTELLDEGTRVGTFDVGAFHEDLEAAAGIAPEDSDEEEARKLEAFVTDERGASPLRQVL